MTTTNSALYFFEVHALRPPSLFIELSTILLVTFPFSVKISDSGFLSSSPALLYILVLGDVSIYKNYPCKHPSLWAPQSSHFQYYVPPLHFSKMLSWSYALKNFLPYYYITSRNLDFQYSVYSSDQSSLNFLSLPSLPCPINLFGAATSSLPLLYCLFFLLCSCLFCFCGLLEPITPLHIPQLPHPSHFPSYSLEKPNPILNRILYLLHFINEPLNMAWEEYTTMLTALTSRKKSNHNFKSALRVVKSDSLATISWSIHLS